MYFGEYTLRTGSAGKMNVNRKQKWNCVPWQTNNAELGELGIILVSACNR